MDANTANKILQTLENLDKKMADTGKKIVDLDVKFDKRFDKLESRMDKLESRMDINEIQTKENTQILKALMHSVEVTNARQEGMIINVAKMQGDIENIKSDLTQIKRNLTTVEIVSANNSADIAILKAV